MHGLRKLYPKDVAFQCKDWKGRDIFCDRVTARNHVARYHLDAALAVDRLKANLASPHFVVECRGADSENGIYSLVVGDHPWLLVAIKLVWVARSRMKVSRVRVISTWYSFPQEMLERELERSL
jgi:hypothetical protein